MKYILDFNGGPMEIQTPTDLPMDVEASKERVFSSLRIKYAAEVQLIIQKWGRLEDIRKTLGLSQRKICQLLLVDPSAWTRWTRSADADEAPPHIFRALSWYLLLLDKSPELSPYVFLQNVARPQIPENEIRKVTERISDDFKRSLDNQKDLKYELLLNEVSELQRVNQLQRTWLIAISAIIGLLAVGAIAQRFL